MGKLFGTDGIRGVVGENLTADLAFRTGKAIAAVLKEEKGRKPVITIGKDTRISSDMLESALIAGICSVGGDVMPFGVLPTPAVAYLTVLKGADAGIVISASHNPYEHNGIKVFNEKGYKLPDAIEEQVEEKILTDIYPAATHGEIGVLRHGLRQSREAYIDHLAGTIVATVMSNLGLHEFCRENGVGLVCTSVGDRNVLEKMNECGYKLGGEQSGHTIFTDYATTGDGQLTALQFLDVLARSGKKASELASVCPQYPQVLLNVAVSHERGVKDAIMASDALSAAIAEEEGKLSGEGRVLVRPSGTEALIRVMVEAKTEQIALLAAENLVNVIKML